MDDDDVATEPRDRHAPAAATTKNNAVLLLLSLSLSPGGRRHHRHHRAARAENDDDGGGAFRCGRRFPTFQALGGHRTSHKRPLVRAHGLDLLLGAWPAGNGKGGAARRAVHRCHACGAVFPTGQALGGHMRRHRAAFGFPAKLETVSSELLSEDGDDDDGDESGAAAGGMMSSTLIQFL